MRPQPPHALRHDDSDRAAHSDHGSAHDHHDGTTDRVPAVEPQRRSEPSEHSGHVRCGDVQTFFPCLGRSGPIGRPTDLRHSRQARQGHAAISSTSSTRPRDPKSRSIDDVANRLSFESLPVTEPRHLERGSPDRRECGSPAHSGSASLPHCPRKRVSISFGSALLFGIGRINS